MKKIKDPNRLRFKDYFGTTTMSFTDSMAATLMGSMFMVYLTDYAGIGKWGAILGSALLVFARLFDAVNDPLEGWLMDRAKVGKLGKYKPFIILSILTTTVGIGFLYFIPEALADSPVLISLWVIFFYLLYDIGVSFFAPNLVYRTMTLKENERAKLIIGPRLANMVLGVVCGSLIAIIHAVNAGIGNMHTAFGLTVAVVIGIGGLISLLGISMVKEKYHAVRENDEDVKITDIFKVLKNNKALNTVVLSTVFSGFVWTFLFACMGYYSKWAYCADLTTGAVDPETHSMISLVGGMMMFLPLIVGTLIATPMVKAFKSALKLHRAMLLTEGVVGGLMFVAHFVGALPNSPFLFFSLLAITATCIGIDFIPQEMINLECMDYELYISGKDRAALCNACNKFVNKAQNALSSGLVGIVLVAIGYVVDSATDTYLGDLAAIPGMLNWFVVIMGLIPCFLGIAAYLVMKRYPITDEIRAKMKETVTQ